MRKHHVFGTLLSAIALTAFMTGCYTQVGTVRDDRDDDFSSRDRDQSAYGYTDSQPGYDSTVADSGRYDEEPYETARHRVYFDYYYPSFSVGLGWGSPWYWGSGIYIGYDPFFYPSYYPWNYYWWGYPGISPYPWYVYPQYRDPGYHGPYYSHRYGGTRTIGNTRTGGNYRGGSAVYRGGGASTLIDPDGKRYAPRSATRGASVSQPRVSTGRQIYESGRAPAPAERKGYREGSTKRAPREGYRSEPPRYRYDPPRSSGGNTRGGEQRSGSGRSYSPPPSPPSHGGGAPASSGGRSSSGSRESSGSRGGTRR